MVIYNSNDSVSESLVFYPSSKFPHQEFYSKALTTQRKIFSNQVKQKEDPLAAKAVDDRLKEAFLDPSAYFVVFLEDDKPTGVVTVYPRKEYVFLFELQVVPPSRYAAIAKKLLHFVVQKFKGKKLFGVVHRSNPVMHTYWKLGCSESPQFLDQEYPQWRQEDGWVALVYSASFINNETHLSRLNSLADGAGVGNEAIQDTTGLSRPVFLIQDDAVVNEPKKWMYTELLRMPDSVQELNKKLHCIGAVEFADGRLAGTCWMIHPGFVCTTKHIAGEFYNFTADGEVTESKQQPVVNFGREYDRIDEPSQRFSVERLAFVDKEQDIAIFKLQNFSGTDCLVVEGAAYDQWKYLVEDEVFVVGYPARDGRNPESLVNQVFGQVFEKKRLAFGKLTNYNRGDVFQHSASTLAGNAGSPVLGAKSLRVLGVHTGGMFNEGNQCVAFPKLREMLSQFIAANIK